MSIHGCDKKANSLSGFHRSDRQINHLMFAIPCTVFLAAYSLDYLAKVHVLPRFVSWFPEILSIFSATAAAFYLGLEKRVSLPLKYLLLFCVTGILIAISVIVNNVQPGTIFIGIRSYLKYIPFFLLPVIYEYTERQTGLLLRLVAFLGVLQFPISIYQRFFLYKNLSTGDVVSGTLIGSGVLSIILVASIVIATAFWIRKEIRTREYILLVIALFIPTTINETKIVLVILPLALIIVVLNSARELLRLRDVAKVLASTLLLLIVFSGIYQKLYPPSSPDTGSAGVFDFLTSEAEVSHYLYSGASESRGLGKIGRNGFLITGETPEVDSPIRRLDSIVAPWRVLGNDPMKLILGVGIGNVTSSFLGDGFSGKYSYYFEVTGAGMTALSILTWELGIGGLVFSLLFLLFIFRDARALSRCTGVNGGLALGWLGVLVIMTVATSYVNVIDRNILGILFWFFSGHIVASLSRIKGCGIPHLK